MGVFINVLIVKGHKEDEVRKVLEKYENHPDWNLVPAECQYQEYNDGVTISLNDWCAGYESMTQELSAELACPVMLCYIYDGDYWGYYFYENGMEIDSFSPIPDYFEEISDEERQRFAGNSKVIAQYFNVDEQKIKNYLQQWSDDMLDSEESSTAYEDDEFSIGEDWQLTDFMRKIGYPYE